MLSWVIAAKQEAFEEAAKLKHQFRALDDDEVDFLDSIDNLTRQKEAEVRRETAEGLNQFRRMQEEAEQKALMGVGEDGAGNGLIGGGSGGGGVGEGEEQVSWVPAGGKKRKKGKEEKEGLKGMKLRKTSSTADDAPIPESIKPASTTSNATKSTTSSTAALANEKTTPALSKAPSEAAAPKPALGLGLAGYSSDED